MVCHSGLQSEAIKLILRNTISLWEHYRPGYSPKGSKVVRSAQATGLERKLRNNVVDSMHLMHRTHHDPSAA